LGQVRFAKYLDTEVDGSRYESDELNAF
jgi:hypothetical protein